MRKKLFLFFVMVTVGLCSLVQADEGGKKRLAEQLLLEMGVHKNTEMVMSQVAKMQENVFATMPGQKGDDPKAKEFIDKMWNLIRKELAWENVKDDFVGIYSEVFTEAEMKELIDFYKSPAGRKYVEKTPELMKRSMEVSQARTRKLLPELKKLIGESVERKP